MDPIAALNASSRPPPLALSRGVPDSHDQRGFASVLNTQDRGLAGAAASAESPETRARRAAEDIVSMTLVQPMLDMAREANRAPPPFGPGPGEKSFGKLLDAQLSRSIVQSASYPLVDRLADDLLRRPTHASAGPAAGVTL